MEIPQDRLRAEVAADAEAKRARQGKAELEVGAEGPKPQGTTW